MDKISRREFIRLTGYAAAAAALAACGSQPPQPTSLPTAAAPTLPAATAIPTPVPTLTRTAIPAADPLTAARVLRRITFAPLPTELDAVYARGLDAFIEEQLSPASIPDVDVEKKLTALKTLTMSPLQLSQIEKREQPPTELTQAALLRAVYSHRQLNELMVDFWTNHFNITVQKNITSYLKTVDDRAVIRPHALGSFRDLLLASAHSPAMLVYLDNVLSTKEKPNENYARELLELHTLGVDGGYTQLDVKEAARAFTGWAIEGLKGKNPGEFLFNLRNHDENEKVILGKKLAAKRGIKDGEDLLDLLAAHPSTAKFISRKLVQRFVSDEPPAALVEKAAEAFTRSGGNIRSVMSVILRSAEFRASLGQKAKRPFEFIVSALRATRATVNPDRPTLIYLEMMGQPLFRLQTPDGYPDTAQAWATTNGFMSRWNFSLALATNQLKDSQVDLTTLFNAAGGADEILVQLSSLLLGEPLPESARTVLRKFINDNTPGKALPALTALALSAPVFQYR